MISVNYDEITEVSDFWDGSNDDCWVVMTQEKSGKFVFLECEDEDLHYGDITNAHAMSLSEANSYIAEYGGCLVDLRKVKVAM